MENNSKNVALSSLYLRHFGDKPSRIVCLKGDGSDREVYRLFSENRPSVIGIFGPNQQENNAFVSFSQSFARVNLPVPRIFAVDENHHVYLEEDLGNITLYEWYLQKLDKNQCDEIEQKYKKILSWLVRFQFEGHNVVDYGKCYQFEIFHESAIQFDLEYFDKSFLQRFSRLKMNRKRLARDYSFLARELSEARSDYFLYRDFQSKNIMIRNKDVYFIDYQSGRKGALQYDVASLLFDANLTIENSLRNNLLEHYLDLLSSYERIDAAEFKHFYFDFALIRMLQALAAFSHLAFNKGKRYFLRNIPIALDNIKTLLDMGCVLNSLDELGRLFIDDLFENSVFYGDDYR